ncbi:MAG: ROK family protein [Chloroflexi bacterium]|nr:MAG: ROK family protein [Chloroflexota bacterium]
MQNEDINMQDQLPLVVGVDLGGTQIRTAVLRGPTLLSRVSLLTGANPSPDRILPRIYTAIQEVLDKAGATLEQVAGIGIAAPGPLVYLTISTGIGGGVIMDGKILEGANGSAGELGHMTIDWHGERCNCGNIGCLESIASGTNIARKANEAIHAGEGIELLTFARTMLEHSSTVPDPSALPTQGHDANTVELRSSIFAGRDELNEDSQRGSVQEEEHLHVNARTVALAAEAGVPLARAIIQNAAEAIGVGLVNIIHCFNPEIIILGGGVTQMGPMLMEPAQRVVQERAMKFPRESVRIVQAQLGHNVGLIGAGALIYYHKNIKIKI